MGGPDRLFAARHHNMSGRTTFTTIVPNAFTIVWPLTRAKGGVRWLMT